MRINLPLLPLTVLAGLLMAAFTTGEKQDQPEVLMHAAGRRQVVDSLYTKPLRQPGQCYVQPEFALYLSLGHANASLGISQCSEQLGNGEAREPQERLLRDYEEQSIQVPSSRTRLALPNWVPDPKKSFTIRVALMSEYSERISQTLPWVKGQTITGLTDQGVPPWLWCMLHPRWCKN